MQLNSDSQVFLCLEDELMRIAAQVELSEAQRKQLETWATGRKSPVRLAERARMILLAGQGKKDKEIGMGVGVWGGTVGRWRARFITGGLTGIRQNESPPRGTPRNSAAQVQSY